MLVLSRKKNEQIVIADNIVVTVVEIRGSRVRLAVEAPRAVPVRRSEVQDRVRVEQIRQQQDAVHLDEEGAVA